MRPAHRHVFRAAKFLLPYEAILLLHVILSFVTLFAPVEQTP